MCTSLILFYYYEMIILYIQNGYIACFDLHCFSQSVKMSYLIQFKRILNVISFVIMHSELYLLFQSSMHWNSGAYLNSSSTPKWAPKMIITMIITMIKDIIHLLDYLINIK